MGAVRLLGDQRGISTVVLSVFLMVAILFVFLGWSFISTVENDRAVVKAALDLALQAATAKGATVPQPGIVLWNSQDALQAATEAVAFDLPVVRESKTSDGADFAPNQHAPRNWGAPISLTRFQTSDLGLAPLCPDASGSREIGPYVTAYLSLPIRFTFMGKAFTYTVKACDTDVITTYNGHRFKGL